MACEGKIGNSRRESTGKTFNPKCRPGTAKGEGIKEGFYMERCKGLGHPNYFLAEFGIGQQYTVPLVIPALVKSQLGRDLSLLEHSGIFWRCRGRRLSVHHTSCCGNSLSCSAHSMACPDLLRFGLLYNILFPLYYALYVSQNQ